jgi:hypothetical protein
MAAPNPWLKAYLSVRADIRRCHKAGHLLLPKPNGLPAQRPIPPPDTTMALSCKIFSGQAIRKLNARIPVICPTRKTLTKDREPAEPSKRLGLLGVC